MCREDMIELYKKFPAILKEKLENGDIKLPDEAQFIYKEILAYRGICRKSEDYTPLNLNDMKSYYEEGRKPRGMIVSDSDPHLYAVSLYKDIKSLKNALKFPRPNKKVARGYVYEDGGPQQSNETSHISWWLYENVSFDEFTIMEDLNG